MWHVQSFIELDRNCRNPPKTYLRPAWWRWILTQSRCQEASRGCRCRQHRPSSTTSDRRAWAVLDSVPSRRSTSLQWCTDITQRQTLIVDVGHVNGKRITAYVSLTAKSHCAAIIAVLITIDTTLESMRYRPVFAHVTCRCAGTTFRPAKYLVVYFI